MNVANRYMHLLPEKVTKNLQKIRKKIYIREFDDYRIFPR